MPWERYDEVMSRQAEIVLLFKYKYYYFSKKYAVQLTKLFEGIGNCIDKHTNTFFNKINRSEATSDYEAGTIDNFIK